MILSQMTGTLKQRFGDKEAIRMIAEAGFDAYDYSFHVHNDESPVYNDNYKEYIAEIAETAKKYNIICNQTHSFYPSVIYGDDEFNERAFFKTVRGLEISSMLGAKAIVVHPGKSIPEEVGALKFNIDFYNRLLPYCKKFNIKIAVENMFYRDQKCGCIRSSSCGFGDEFRSYLEQLDPKWFVACLDLGHSGLVGDEAQYAVKALGKKHLHALHVHDNDYLNDRHTLPFLGKIEWEEVCKALGEIGYNDEFTYEADNFLKGFPNELIPQALKFMYEVAKYLAGRIEFYKNGVNL